jgi:predicted DNA-binding protein (MmcQ/YjbR family)
MNVEKFRTLCLSMPGATETVQWGNDLVFKVGGKMFAVAALDAAATHRASFKCSDEGFSELQEIEGAVPAPYLARAKWIALERFDVLGDRDLQDRIAQAYGLVAAKLTKKEQAKISATPSPAKPRKGSGSPGRSRPRAKTPRRRASTGSKRRG